VRFGSAAGRLVLVRDGCALDVARASGGRFAADPRTALGGWPRLRAWADDASWDDRFPLDAAGLGPPVPDPRQVFAVALNYRPHAAEAGFVAPAAPLIFTKFPSCIAGPVTDVVLPAGHVDWEAELVAVVGTGGRGIGLADGWNALAGVTLGQDLSERVLQSQGTPAQFSLAKSYAGFGPTGPVVVTPDELPDPDDLGLECVLDGEVVQRARTSEMIFGTAELVHRLSLVCELFPGDLIFTGTPGGVGNRRTPPRFLRAGETLVSRLEHVGEITQHFTARPG
jgi:2-keto-4-pentenoate hydratase/2-oxohepta-3-ene-1,7-dioic acid hydratase in catechol pathway